MRKKILDLIPILFLIFTYGLFAYSALAAEPAKITYTFLTPIPGLGELNVNGDTFKIYVQTAYSFIIGSVGILATVEIMWAGFKWITSQGNPGKIGEAKEVIWAAIIGLFLAFFSWIILNIINPALLTPTFPSITGIEKQNASPNPPQPTSNNGSNTTLNTGNKPDDFNMLQWTQEKTDSYFGDISGEKDLAKYRSDAFEFAASVPDPTGTDYNIIIFNPYRENLNSTDAINNFMKNNGVDLNSVNFSMKTFVGKNGYRFGYISYREKRPYEY